MIKNIFFFSVIILGFCTPPASSQQIDRATLEKLREAGYGQTVSKVGTTSSQKNVEEDRSRQNYEFKRDSYQNDGLYDATRQSQITKEQGQTQVFGKNIFSIEGLSFTPSTNISTPKDYILAPGDELIVDVWGSTVLNVRQKISPDGTIVIDNAGVIGVVGLTIEQAEKKIKTALSKMYASLSDEESTSFMSLSLGELRTIKVNIVGEATIPGTYNLSSLSTLFNALYAAKGVNDIGSMREIKLYRNNKEVAHLDVYSFLMHGSSDANVRLQDADLIVIPPYKNMVKLEGEVRRPMIFELKESETLADLLQYAGGMTAAAYKVNLSVNRRDGEMYKINRVTADKFNQFPMMDGDRVVVDGTIQKFSNRVAVAGAVWRPGYFEITDNTLGLKALLEKAGGVRGDIFLDRGVVYRRNESLEREMVAFSVKSILDGSVPDLLIQPDDSVYVASLHDLKEEYSVIVRGEVNGINSYASLDSTKNKKDFDYKINRNSFFATDGRRDNVLYPYYKGMSLSDAVFMAGGLKLSASESKITVYRRLVDPRAEEQSNELAKEFSFSIDQNLSLQDQASDFQLEPYDVIFVHRSPVYKEQQLVTINGEVIFPGDYVLTDRSFKLTDLIESAGGATQNAFIRGASLIRRKSEEDLIRERVMLDLARNNRTGNDSLAYEIKESVIVGIDLEKAMKNPSGVENLILKEGDRITIPLITSTVKISGAVLYPNTVVMRPNSNVKDYINRAGGFVKRAKKKPYIVYMNGDVATARAFKNTKIEPGCEIVVTIKPERRGAGNVLSEILGLTTSTATLAAMVATMTK